MASGTWTTQNKVRPGAYINFKAVSEPQVNIGDRGVVAIPIAMDWGPDDTVIELLSTDLIDGKSVAKIGYDSSAEQILSIAQALQNCYKALIYRVDTGGSQATATINSTLTVTAKYKGVLGNKIAISIVENEDAFDVITMLDGVQKDLQTASQIEELVPNDFVIFSGTGELQASAGVTLTTGTNGTVNTTNYDNFISKIQNYTFNTIGLPSTESEAVQKIVEFVKDQRDRVGNKIQAVVYNYAEADHEGIISCDQGYMIGETQIPPIAFICYFAGLTAGANVNESNTYHVIDGATEIIGMKSNEEIIEALQSGKLVLSATKSGSIVVEKDINTLVNYGTDKSYAFTKNRVIRCLDGINNDIVKLWEDTFVGKVDNNDTGRNLFKTSIISYLNELVSLGAINEFDTDSDITVEAGNDIESVVASIAITPVDSMEKLYLTVLVG